VSRSSRPYYTVLIESLGACPATSIHGHWRERPLAEAYAGKVRRALPDARVRVVHLEPSTVTDATNIHGDISAERIS